MIDARLPLPVASLCRRARNAKSPKDRHNTLYWAWEVSLRLSVSAQPPSEVGELARGSVATWAQAATLGDETLLRPELLEAYRHFVTVGSGRKSPARGVTPRKLLDTLAPFRNAVIGHGSTLADDVYDYARANEIMLEGLLAAWEAELFWPKNSRLVYVESSELDVRGERVHRILDLTGFAGQIVESPGPVTEALEVRRLYQELGGAYVPLHPWLVLRESELREQVFFFNGLGRKAVRYLDFTSGEAMRGKELDEVIPNLNESAYAYFKSDYVDPGSRAIASGANVLGDFQLEGELGRGGMGVVHLARQADLGREVALKVLPREMAIDPVSVGRFRREINCLGRCDHPNVVKILTSGEAQGTYYYAMERVDGADLSDVIAELALATTLREAVDRAWCGKKATAGDDAMRTVDGDRHAGEAAGEERPSQQGPRPSRELVGELVRLFRDAAEGVSHLHDNGIVHRDLKPANLMVTRTELRVVVMDLGLAMVQDTSISLTRSVQNIVGTLLYMPPEQLQRNLLQVDHRADVYSLGASAYEAICGQRIFDGDSEARLIEQILHETPVPAHKVNPVVPRDLSTILSKCLQKDPRMRYASAAALAADLEAFVLGAPIEARPPSTGYLLALAIRQNKPLAAAVFALLGFLVFGFVWTAYQNARLDRLAVRTNALRLAAESASAAPDDPALAALLGLEAIERSDEEATRNAVVAALGELNEVVGYLGHEGRVSGLAISADGRSVLTAGVDRTARLWDLQTADCRVFPLESPFSIRVRVSAGGRLAAVGVSTEVLVIDLETGRELRRLWRPEQGIVDLAFAPDAEVVVAAGADDRSTNEQVFGLVTAWDARTGSVLWELGGVEAAGEERLPLVQQLALSPDGRKVLARCQKPGEWSSFALLLDVTTGKRLASLAEEASVAHVSFSPDGSRIAAGFEDGSARVWPLDAAGVVGEARILEGHGDVLREVGFSPDGRLLATASWDHTARVWDVETGRPVTRPLVHRSRLTGVRFSPDSSKLLTTSEDTTARVWNVRDGSELLVVEQHSAIGAGEFTPNGNEFVTCTLQGEVRRWRLASARSLVVDDIGIDPRGRIGLTAPDGEVLLCDPLWGAEVARFATPESVSLHHVAFDRQGERIAAGSREGEVFVWDLATSQLLHHLKSGVQGEHLDCEQCEWSPDGQMLLAALGRDTLVLFDTVRGVEIAQLDVAGCDGRAGFVGDGQTIYACRDAGEEAERVDLWSVQERRWTASLEGHEATITAVRFDREREEFLTAARDGTVRRWREASERAGYRPYRGDPVDALVHLPGGGFVVASADAPVLVYDRDSTVDPVLELTGHEGTVQSLSTNELGTYLVVVTESGCRVFDLRDGRSLFEVEVDETTVAAAVFVSRDEGDELVVVRRNGHVTGYPLGIDRRLEYRLPRRLTAAERKRFLQLEEE